jgi:hypothetical protein
MLSNDVIAFAVSLALALIMLIKWKRRRIVIARRVNRGLRGYVSARPAAAPTTKPGATHEVADRELSAA